MSRKHKFNNNQDLEHFHHLWLYLFLNKIHLNLIYMSN